MHLIDKNGLFLVLILHTLMTNVCYDHFNHDARFINYINIYLFHKLILTKQIFIYNFFLLLMSFKKHIYFMV